MSVTYNTIIRNAAVRINAITGATSSALESAYITTPLTAAQVDSADFTLSVLKDTCLLVEEKLAHAIANTGNHPWRSYLSSTTAAIAHRGFIPTVDASSPSVRPLIGVLGSVYDATDLVVCTEKPLEVIRRRVDNPGTFFKTSVYWYKIDGVRIYHTRSNVKIDCCSYDRAAQATAIATLGNSTILPDVLEEAMVCGMVSMLVRDDAFTAQSQIYRNYFNDTLQMISKGLGSVPAKTIPFPTMTANAA